MRLMVTRTIKVVFVSLCLACVTYNSFTGQHRQVHTGAVETSVLVGKNFLMYIRQGNSSLTIQRNETYNYTVSDNMKKWFGENLTFPLTLSSDYLINPKDLCSEETYLDYLIVVHSGTSHVRVREAIRETFGNNELFSPLKHRIVFLLGIANKPRHTKKIMEESSRYNDIVQGDFMDSYHNLTLKGVMGLRWVNTFCSNAKVLIKIDDDTFVNMFGVVQQLLPDFIPKSRHLKCTIIGSHVGDIHRKGESQEWLPGSKWELDDSDFKGLTRYPFTKCNGGFVMISGDLVAPMLAAAKVNHAFWVDDVYLFGMLPETVGDVTFEHLGPVKTTSKREMSQCLRKKGVLGCPLMVLNHNTLNDEDVGVLWDVLDMSFTDNERASLFSSTTF